MNRKAWVVWHGGLSKGHGKIYTESGSLQDVCYSFKGRMEDATGTNPEELVGAALAGCFTMALVNELEDKGYSPEEIETTTLTNLGKQEGQWSISKIDIVTEIKIDRLKDEEFQQILQDVKENCVMAKLLKAEITAQGEIVDDPEIHYEIGESSTQLILEE